MNPRMSPWAKSAVPPSAASLTQWPSGLWGPYHSGPSMFPAPVAGNPLENGRLASLIPLREAWFPVLPVLPCTLAQQDNTGRRCFLVQDKRCATPPLGSVPQPRWYGGRWSAGKFQSPTLLPKPGLRQGSTVHYLPRRGLFTAVLCVARHFQSESFQYAVVCFAVNVQRSLGGGRCCFRFGRRCRCRR